MTTETTSAPSETTPAPAAHIRIEVVETTVTTFVLTSEQLADHDLPTTLDELKALDEGKPSDLAVTLIDDGQGYVTDFAVTDREVLFTGVTVMTDDAGEETPSAK